MTGRGGEGLLCPLCKGVLSREGGSLVCGKAHRFDLSAEGYVNLAVGKSGAGDNRAMCRARRDFLAAGYYRPFAEGIGRALAAAMATPGVVCDAGCGEGYYLRAAREFLPTCSFIGFDLAKDSIRFAAKAERGREDAAFFAVAGIFDMPLPDASCAAVTSVFAPVPAEEARRVLGETGVLLVARPGARHLSGMKEILYKAPYDNPEKPLSFPGFRLLSEERIFYRADIGKDDMKNLFYMTPYCYKTAKEDAERFFACGGFSTELDFRISLFRKEPL